MAPCDSNYSDLIFPSLALCLYSVCSFAVFLYYVHTGCVNYRYRLNRVFRVILKTVFLGLKVTNVTPPAEQNTGMYVTVHLYGRELSKLATHDLLLLVLLLMGRLVHCLWTSLPTHDSYMYKHIWMGVEVFAAAVGLWFCAAVLVNVFALVIIYVSRIRDMACRIVMTSSLLAIQAVSSYVFLAAEHCASDPFSLLNNVCLLLLLTVSGSLTYDVVFTRH